MIEKSTYITVCDDIYNNQLCPANTCVKVFDAGLVSDCIFSGSSSMLTVTPSAYAEDISLKNNAEMDILVGGKAQRVDVYNKASLCVDCGGTAEHVSIWSGKA